MNDTAPPSDDFGWYRGFTSSWIAGFHFDSFTSVLWLETKEGKQYKFVGFPKAKWAALKAAPSKGKFYDTNLRDRYQAK